MKIPSRLIPLVEDGIIEEVVAQVKSGKEADVFVVRIGDELRCAKVYKEANNRSFRQAVQYQEGRKVQNSRSARAMSKRTNYGQKEAENSWITAEVEALNKLAAAGLRVPKPFGFFEGVLIMELIVDAEGNPAPRLNDISLSAEDALLYHEELIAQIVRMLCSGIIHGDLSEFNVLVDVEGPVIIDLPQAVNAAGNNSAGMMFLRDVDNMARYFGRFVPEILKLQYGKEIWALYEKGKLTPHVELTGKYQGPVKQADVNGVLNAIGDARKEHEFRMQKKAPDSRPADTLLPRTQGYPPPRPQGNPGPRHPGHQGPRPNGNQPPWQSGNQAQRSGGNQPGRPMGNQGQRPSGNQPPRQTGNHAPWSQGNQPPRPPGNQHPRPPGYQPPRPSGNPPPRPQGNPPPKPPEDQPPKRRWGR